MNALHEVHRTGDMILFAQVVEAGTITGGSKRLGLERSTVSRRISSLEDRLGVSLLERSTRKLRLTEIGRQYYQHCLRVVEAAEDAEAAARGYRVEPSGLLSIAASFCEADKFLSEIIAAFVETYAKIHVELMLTGDIRDAQADLLLHCSESAAVGAQGTRVGDISESLWASPDFLSRLAMPQSPDSLQRAATICLAGTDSRLRWQLSAPGERIDVTIYPRFRLSTLAGCRDACVSGLGIAKLPDYLCKDAARKGELVRAFPAWQVSGTALFALHERRGYLSRKAQTFSDFLREHLLAH